MSNQHRAFRRKRTRASNRPNLNSRRIGVEQLETRAMLAGNTFGFGDWGWAGALAPDNAIVKSVASDPAGNVYIAGSFSGAPDFDMGTGVKILASNHADGFVAKYSASGALQWATQIGGAMEQYVEGMTIDPAGNVLLCGLFMGAATFGTGSGVTNSVSQTGFDAFIWKLDSAGQSQWVKTFSGTLGCWLDAIATDATGAAIAVGSFRDSTIDFDPGVGTKNLTAINSNSVVVKLDASGGYQWATNFERGEASDVAVDSLGSVLVTGTFQYTVDFDPGPGLAGLSSDSLALYAVKLSASGAYQWAKTVVATDYHWLHLPTVAVDSFDNVYVAGRFKGAADFDPTDGVDPRSAVGDSWDAFATKFTSAGDYQWSRQISGPGDEYVASLAVNTAQQVVLVGKFTEQVDADPGAGADLLTSAGSSDAMVIRLSQGGKYVSAKRYGGVGDDYATVVVFDSQGSTVVAGQFNDVIRSSPVEFGPSPGDASLVGGDRPAFILRLANHSPADIDLSATSIAENQPIGAAVGMFSTVDSDVDDAFAYSLVSDTGGTDNASFTISGNALHTAASFDFEAKSSYSIRVRSTDAGGLFTEKVLTISVADVLEASSFLFGFKHVNETGADQYLVESVGMRKYSEWQSPPITYWGPSANNAEGRLVYKFPLSVPSLSVRLHAHSPNWDFFNEPGGYGRGASALEVSRDGTTWVTLRNSLEPRQWGVDWTYSDLLPSTVVGGTEVWVRMRFYVESAPNTSYTVAQFGRSTTSASTNVFEIRAELADIGAQHSPTDIGLSATSIAENQPIGATVGAFSTEDPDVGDTFTYSLVSGTGGTDNASFTIVGNELRTAVALNTTPQSSYAVRVRSTDAGGLFTEKVFSITVTRQLGSPTAVMGSPIDRAVTLSWLPPGGDGGAPVTEYRVQYSVPGGATWTKFNTLSPITSASVMVSGLSNGLPHIFRVRAVSQFGLGPWSVPSAAVTPRGPALPPTLTSVTAGIGQVTATWATPASNGSAITGYVFQFSDGVNRPRVRLAVTNSHTIQNLVNGMPYSVRIAAVTAYGRGDWSPWSSAVTPLAPAAPPAITSVVAGYGQVAAAWSTPSGNGAEITGYVLQLSDGVSRPRIRLGVMNTYTIHNLTNGTPYAVRVAAVTAYGRGNWSPWSATVMPVAKPSP